MLAVTAAAVSLAMTGCVKAPAVPVSGNLVGHWSFAGLLVPTTATIDESNAVTVTVGTGMSPISTKAEFAEITMVVVKGSLAEDAEQMTFTLTLAEGDDAVVASVSAALQPPEFRALTAKSIAATIATLIGEAQDGTVMIDLDTVADPDTMTVTGSFIDALFAAIELQVPATGLMATRVR